MQRIPSLDGLRAVSILFVIAGHALWNYPVSVFHHLAYFGVKIFFVISGYLITGILVKEISTTGTVDLRRFYWRRIWRLMPAFYVYLFAIVVMTLIGLLPLHRIDFAYSLLYLMNYYPGGGPWAVGHFWSLAVEEQFYFLWPASLFFFGIARSRKALYWTILAAPLLRFGLFPWKQELGTIYGTMFPTSCDAIAVGCLFAFLREELHKNSFYLNFLRRNGNSILLPAALLLEGVLPARLAVSLGAAAVNLAVVLLIDGFVTFESSRMGRILNSSVLRQVGVMSYSIYLWQQVFLNPEQRAVWTRLPGNLVLAFLCASFSYFVVERPVLMWSRRSERTEMERLKKPTLEREGDIDKVTAS